MLKIVISVWNTLIAVFSVVSWFATALSAVYVLADLVSLEKCLAWLVFSFSSLVYCVLVGSIRFSSITR